MCKSGVCTLLLLHLLTHLADGGEVPGLCDCLSAEAASELGLPLEIDGVNLTSFGINSSTYGIGCAKHDMNTTMPCRERAEAPEWCEAAWCWVDPERCSLNLASGDFFLGRFYSYATCGYHDSYKNSASSLRGKVVKVGWKVNTGGWMGVYHRKDELPPAADYGLDVDDYFGPTAALVKKAASDHEWNLSSARIPEEIAPLCPYDNTFTCCIWATGLGYLDVCATEARITTERVAMADFYHTSDETSHLIVNAKVTFLDLMVKPFRPFHPLSWLCICIVVCVVLVVKLIPRVHAEAPAWLNMPRRCWWSGSSDDGLVDLAQYQHMISFCGFKISLMKDKPNYVFAGCGLQLFFELLFATYTANLFLHLVYKNDNSNVGSMEQVRRNGMTVCIHRSDDSIMQEYPHVQYARDPGDGMYGIEARDDIFRYMDAGICDIGITNRQDFERMLGEDMHCNKVMFEAAVWSKPKGIAVNPLKSGPLRSAMHELREKGYWLEQLKASKPFQNDCSSTGETETSLSLPDMYGLLIITGTVMIFGYCFDVARWWTHMRRRLRERRLRAQALPETDPDAAKHVRAMVAEETGSTTASSSDQVVPQLSRKHTMADALTTL